MRTEPTGVPDLAVALAYFAAGLDVAHLAADVVDAVKINIADLLSCALACSSADGLAEVPDLVKEWGGAPQESIDDVSALVQIMIPAAQEAHC